MVSVKSSNMKTGDVIAFYYNNNILVKRVIAGPGDWVDIDKDGNVFVNNEKLSEPYLDDKAYGETNSFRIRTGPVLFRQPLLITMKRPEIHIR